jgi:RNA polymerase sigma factor (TIGR02999 family)
MATMSDVTRILSAIDQGDAAASAKLLPLVYRELRRLAARQLRSEPSGNSLQPTALVHEAYIRLVDRDGERHWNHRGHFYAAAAESMRRILVERVRRKRTLKRGGDRARLPLDADQLAAPQRERCKCSSEACHRHCALCCCS